jgi:hypothetical protein
MVARRVMFLSAERRQLDPAMQVLDSTDSRLT